MGKRGILFLFLLLLFNLCFVSAIEDVNPDEINSFSTIEINNIPLEEDIDVIVIFNEEINETILQESGAEIKENLESIETSIISADKETIEELQNNPNIEIEPDIELELFGEGEEIVLKNQIIPWGIERVNAPESWEITTGDNIKIAIIDSGIIYHTDLRGKVRGGISFINNSNYWDDDLGHGTSIAGVISALNNNIGIVGVAPDADLYSVKVIGVEGGKLSDVIRGIEWAIKNNMDIIVISLGIPVDSPSLKRIVDEAYNNDIIIVAASGKDGQIYYPAKYSSVISVGAIDENNQLTSENGVGEEMEFVAPGRNIISTGLSGYSSFDGTSMAAPHAAGVIALIKEKNPDYSNNEIRAELQRGALDLGEEGKDNYFGYGLVQFNPIKENLNSIIQIIFPENLNETNFTKVEIIKLEDGKENVVQTLFYNAKINSTNVSVKTGSYKIVQYYEDEISEDSYNISEGEIVVVTLHESSVHGHITSQAMNIWSTQEILEYSTILIPESKKEEGPGLISSCNHFWDPDTNTCSVSGCVDYDYYCAPELAEIYFNNAKYYYNTNRQESYKYLAWTVHLLEDMSVPAHVQLDEHFTAVDSYEGVYLPNNYWNYLSSGTFTEKYTLNELFESMAQKSDNFDSDSKDGEIDKGSRNYFSWSSLQNEISSSDCKVIADNLMPEAERHVAGLYRLFWIQTHVNTFCESGACCDLSQKIMKLYNYQPTGYTDYTYCDGTKYVKKKDFYCTGYSSSPAETNLVIQTCNSNQICEVVNNQAQCSTIPITCYTNSDCGSDSLTFGPICETEMIDRTTFIETGFSLKTFTNYTCVNPGTISSYCTQSYQTISRDCTKEFYEEYGPNYCNNNVIYKDNLLYQGKCSYGDCILEVISGMPEEVEVCGANEICLNAACVCSPNIINSSLSEWKNESCLTNINKMNQSRFLTQYDSNFCKIETNDNYIGYVPSDLASRVNLDMSSDEYEFNINYYGEEVTADVYVIAGEESFKLDKITNHFNFNDPLNSVYSRLYSTEMPLFLAEGIYNYGKINTIYSHSIRLRTNPLTLFADNDYKNKEPNIGFKWTNGENILYYDIEFYNTIPFTDLINTSLPLMGDKYYVKSANASQIVLIGPTGIITISHLEKVKLNGTYVNGLTSELITNGTAGFLNAILLMWNSDGETFLTQENSITMPLFEKISLVFGDFNIPLDNEEISLQSGETMMLGMDNYDLPLMWFDGTNAFLGEENYPLITKTSTFTSKYISGSQNTTPLTGGLNLKEDDRFLVTSLDDDLSDIETLYYEVVYIDWDSSEVLVELKDLIGSNDLTFDDLSDEKDVGDITLSLVQVNDTNVYLKFNSISGTISYNTVISGKGMKITLPAKTSYQNNDVVTGVVINFQEADKERDIGEGKSFTATIKSTTNDKLHVSGTNVTLLELPLNTPVIQNKTFYEYRQTENCIEDICIPNLVNTSWFEWINLSCLTDINKMNQTRFFVQYDSNYCPRSIDKFFYEYRQTENCTDYFCIPNLVNQTNGWKDLNCLINNKTNQSREIIQYDSEFCGTIANKTFYQYQAIKDCDYCKPNPVNSSWSVWKNQSKCINDYILQNRSKVEYDSNYSKCYGITKLPSDLWNGGVNRTYWEYRNWSYDCCTPKITYTTWTEWVNVSLCTIKDSVYQNRTRVKFDSNQCKFMNGTLEMYNKTETESRELNNSCDYCNPNPVNTSWSDWQDQTECINKIIIQNKSRVEYDSNYSTCYAITGLSSDLLNLGENITHWEFQDIPCCITNLVNTSWSDWENESCLDNNKMNQSRYLVEYDSEFCGEVENKTFYDYKAVLDCPNGLIVISPNQEIYSKTSVLFNINSTLKPYRFSKLVYSDNSGSDITLCSNCYGYSRMRTLTNGNHTLLFKGLTFDGKTLTDKRQVLIDSRLPVISTTKPTSSKYTNGSDFYVKYSEDNCKELVLLVNDAVISKIPCDSGRYIEKYLSEDLSEYDGQTVKYRFKIVDIANNVKESRNTSVKVDTTAPEIKNLKVTKSGSYIVFNMSILNEDRYSLYRVEYLDNTLSRATWKPLCTILKGDICYKKVYNRAPSYNFLIRVRDDAGNSDSEVVKGY